MTSTPLTLSTACHIAVVDLVTGGCGLLSFPRPEDDLFDLHKVDREAMLLLLHAHGVEPTPADDDEVGKFVLDGYTADGRKVVGLCVLDPVMGEPTVEQEARSFAELRALLGVVPA